MFSADIQLILKKNKFELMDQENNIWVKEIENQSVTISGDDNSIEVIFEDFETNQFEEHNFTAISLVFEWLENFSNLFVK